MFNLQPGSEPVLTHLCRKNGVKLLDRYRCFVCQKWKHNALFSKKQLGTYTYKIASGQSVDGVSSHLRCMLCNGGQSTELKCQGPCGLVRALDGFSKQARSNGGSQWCQACTAYVHISLQAPSSFPSSHYLSVVSSTYLFTYKLADPRIDGKRLKNLVDPFFLS
jgi:hypothetical protein